MPHCMVPNCANGSRKTKGSGISYHRLPVVQKIRKHWLARIRRENPPKENSCYVCSEHFTPDCFQISYKNVFGQTNKKSLKPDAIPSIFPHSSQKKVRTSSQRRIANKDKAQVNVLTIPQISLTPTAFYLTCISSLSGN